MSHLRRLWVGMVTKNTRDSGTNDRTVLIVNVDGTERLHNTFQDTSQRDQERGEANLYELNVQGNGIIPEDLTNSSVRLGIRGGNAWRPEHYVVWGERLTGGAIIPIAVETDIGVTLSTQTSEGNISLPLRLVGLAAQDRQINRLLMMMTTADVSDAGTNSGIELQISTGGAVVVDFDIPNTPQEEQERAQANFYYVPVNSRFTAGDLASDSIQLSIKGSDKWLPSSFFLFGLDDATGRPEFLVPLVHIRDWNLGWLSTDTSEGVSSVSLPQV